MTLTGCETTSTSPKLATIPSDIQVCFDKLVPKPKPGPMSRQDVVGLIGKLRQSEVSKSLCGKRLIEWYNTQKKVFER